MKVKSGPELNWEQQGDANTGSWLSKGCEKMFFPRCTDKDTILARLKVVEVERKHAGARVANT